MWITINEPQVVAHQATGSERTPRATDDALAAAATHHLLLAHGLALERLRSVMPAARLGSHSTSTPFERSARRRRRPPRSPMRAEPDLPRPGTAWALPVERARASAAAAALIHDGDMELARAPIDFLGINYYTPHYVKLGDWRSCVETRPPSPVGPV